MVNKGWGGYGFPDAFDESFAASAHAAMVEATNGTNLVEDDIPASLPLGP